MLTEAGVAAMRHAWPVYAAGVHRHFARHLADGEAGTMAAALGRVVASARAEAPETHDPID